MGILEIIMAIILIIACVFIVVVVLMQETKTQMSQTISGSSSDNFYQKNSGRTKEAMLNKATIAAAVTFFVLALAVNIINLHFGSDGKDTSSSTTSSSVSQSESAIADNGESGSTISEVTVSDLESQSSSEGATSTESQTSSESAAAE